MPTYNFRCPKCQYEFSDIFPMKDYDGKKVVCPKCGHRGLNQVFKSGFSLIKKNSSSACPTGTCPLTRG